MGLKHRFVNPQSDGSDATVTRASDWNASHANFVPEIVQTKTAGTAVSSITLDSAPVSGHSVILFLDAFNTSQPSAVSSTNTTWTQLKTLTDGGGQRASIWIGKASASAGAAITVTHSNSFLSIVAIEVTDSLTPTVGLSNAATNVMLTPLKLDATTEGHLIIAGSGTDNTGLANTLSLSVPSAGIACGVVSLLVGYSQGYPAYTNSITNAGALIIVEVT